MANTSTGYVPGSDFGIFVDDTLIAAATENSLQKTRNMINVSNNDNPDDAEYIPGRGDGTVSGSAMVKYDAGYGYGDLNSIYENKTKVTIRYSNDKTGDDEWSFSAYLSELSRTDGDDDVSTLSYTFQRTGGETETNIV